MMVVMPSPPETDTSFVDLVERARSLVRPGRRALLGITGSPGAGKSTLALALVRALAAAPPAGSTSSWVAYVPMDGYHLADSELARLGRAERKGAPDTFDAAGYAALLERLTQTTSGGRDEREVVYAPAFDRTLEQPVAGSIPVFPDCRLVVTEGNYLLLDDPPWRRARSALDEVWFCEVDDDERRQRLVERHVVFGKEPDAAHAWVLGTDEPNAQLVSASRQGADLVVPPLVLP